MHSLSKRKFLNAYAFINLQQARETIQQWMEDYNYNRPHQALGNKTPIEQLDKLKTLILNGTNQREAYRFTIRISR